MLKYSNTLSPNAHSALFPVLLLCCSMLVTGCSEMRILDQPMEVMEHDPREDIRLTNMETDITSGGLVIQRVHGRDAIFAQTRNIMNINDMMIETFDPATGRLSGETQAATGTIYLANHPEVQRSRSDMEFTGGVVYRAPAKEDPTTDSMKLETENLLFDKESGRFYGTTHTILMSAPGRTPLRMQGNVLRANQDLSNLSIQGGRMGPVESTETVGTYLEKRREMEILAEDIAREADKAPARMAPLEVAPPAPAPTKAPMPEIPPMAPRPTPTPRP